MRYRDRGKVRRSCRPAGPMCFSADSSLVAGVVLLPAGIYCLVAALRKRRDYLLIAATPLLFGIQQLCEAAVWRGIEGHDAVQVKRAATAFLFFAIGLWPGWVPLGTALIERRPGKRRLFFLLAALGAAEGFICYVPAILHYGDWIQVSILGHSVRYDFSGLPVADGIQTAWRAFYLVAVCLPLFLSRDLELKLLGLTILISAGVTFLLFWYVFISVWCFFAAVLSLQIGYTIYRLTKPEQQH
jgi:hypothetical protein